MKNSLYHIAGLLIMVWVIAFFSFNTTHEVDLLLVFAGIIIIGRIVFNKILTREYSDNKEKLIINYFKT